VYALAIRYSAFLFWAALSLLVVGMVARHYMRETRTWLSLFAYGSLRIGAIGLVGSQARVLKKILYFQHAYALPMLLFAGFVGFMAWGILFQRRVGKRGAAPEKNHAGRVTATLLQTVGLWQLFLAIVLLFAVHSYRLCFHDNPPPPEEVNYFLLQTITTVGYGDLMKPTDQSGAVDKENGVKLAAGWLMILGGATFALLTGSGVAIIQQGAIYINS
jgi:Ion channel